MSVYTLIIQSTPNARVILQYNQFTERTGTLSCMGQLIKVFITHSVLDVAIVTPSPLLALLQAFVSTAFGSLVSLVYT